MNYLGMENDPMGKCSYQSEDLCFNPQKPQKSDIGVEEMMQPLRALIVLPHLIPSTHKKVNKCNTSSRVSDVFLFWPPNILHRHTCRENIQ